MYLKNAVLGNMHELIQEAGGIKPQIYDIYARMLILNEVCEKFLNATSDDDAAAAA